MSLKAFHIFFIAMSIIITLGFAAWVFSGLGAPVTAGLSFMGASSGVLGVGLIIYGVFFIRKSRHIII